MVSGSVKGHELWRVSETMRSYLLKVVFVCLEVWGLVVELGPRGERLGIWLVVYGLSIGGKEIILYLLVLDLVSLTGGV